MSVYQVQKLMFHTRSDSERRRRYLDDPAAFVRRYDLTEAEVRAVLNVDIRALYEMGVNPLLLRPFTELNGIVAKEHYQAIAGLE
jgi:hypothetical protein